MAAREITTGTVIETEGQPLSSLYLIASGTVKASFPGGEITLKKGDIVGLADVNYDSHYFTYTALENVTALVFPFRNKNTVRDLCASNLEITRTFYTSMVNQMLLVLTCYARLRTNCDDIYDQAMDYYEKYMDICARNSISARSLPQFDNYSKLSIEEDIEDWLLGYYASLREFPDDIKHALPDYPAFIIGFLFRASEDIHSTFMACTSMQEYYRDKADIFLQENGIDMFDLYTSLLFRLRQDSPGVDSLTKSIDEIIKFVKSCPYMNKDVISERVSSYLVKRQGLSSPSASGNKEEAVSDTVTKALANSLDVILAYSGVSDELSNYFRKLVVKYKKMSDKAATDNESRALRTEITKYFYEIYTAAFFASLKDYGVPTILKMFFNFGYMDEDLAGMENACYLYNLADEYEGDPSYGVYTIYQWLLAVYDTDKDPSRNEFDTDYLSYIHEQRVKGEITPEREKELMADRVERVKFELVNVFPVVNKITYGRLSIFTPIFCEFNVIKPLETCLVTTDTIVENIKKVLEVDYGAFHRETVYTNEKAGIPKEFVQVKILPDVILVPNVGTRGVMWQEIEGKKRTTPARFMVSAFHLEDIHLTFTRMVGEYRWQMCKRVQGARWNDVTDRSLTSEYFDYVQFYRKNSDLSQDAKDKIKQSLVKAKNSFKEMFVRDYITWVMYEGNGSPRLNKIARTILNTYCPFPYELRKKMMANPLFKDLLERYEIKTNQKLHHIDNVIQKLKNSGVEIPDEILITRNFIEGK